MKPSIHISKMYDNSYNGVFSPDGTQFAYTTKESLFIRKVKDCSPYTNFVFDDQIGSFEFSPDNQYILVQNAKKNLVEARGLYDDTFKAKIGDQAVGIVAAHWVPDSRQIMTFSDMNLKLTVYNLITKDQSIIKSPKSHEKAWAFSSNNKFLAVAERREKKDYIGIYYCMNWQLVNYFQASTFDLSDIKWAPYDNFLLVWDTCLAYRLVAYCPSKTQIFKHEVGNNSLGVKTVKMSQKSEYLAQGTYDDKIKLYNTLCWRLICDIDFKINPNDIDEVKFYKEELTTEHANTYDDQALKRFVQVTSFRILPNKNTINDRSFSGVNNQLIEWSDSNNFLAIKTETFSNYVWIWDMTTMNIHTVIYTLQPVVCLKWALREDMLFFSSGTTDINIWVPTNICKSQPFFGVKGFKVNNLEWDCRGNYLMLSDKSEICIMYKTVSSMMAGNETVNYENTKMVTTMNDKNILTYSKDGDFSTERRASGEPHANMKSTKMDKVSNSYRDNENQGIFQGGFYGNSNRDNTFNEEVSNIDNTEMDPNSDGFRAQGEDANDPNYIGQLNRQLYFEKQKEQNKIKSHQILPNNTDFNQDRQLNSYADSYTNNVENRVEQTDYSLNLQTNHNTDDSFNNKKLNF